MMIFSIFVALVFIQFVTESRSLCAPDQVRDLSTDICQSSCPSQTFILNKGSENVCSPQIPVENEIRPTPERLSFIVILNGLDSSDYNKTLGGANFLRLAFDFGFKSDQLAQSDYSLAFLDQKNSVLEISLHPKTVVYYPATLIIEFSDTSYDNQTSYYFRHQKLSTGLLPLREFTRDEESFLDFTSVFGLPSEITWCVLGLFHSYPVAYFYGKLYMQTFHLIKMANVTFSPMILEYFQNSENKISGIKVPNLPSLILYHSKISSEWGAKVNSFEEFQDRKEDLMMVDNSRKILEFDAFPLFGDNVGIEISLIVIVAILIIILELLFFFVLSGEGEPGAFYKFFSKIRIFLRYNFLLATILGAFPSFIFYGVHQIRLFFIYGKSGSNLANSILAIVCCAILVGALPVFLYKKLRIIHKIKKLTTDEDELDYDEALELRLYGILHSYHKNNRKPYPAFISVFLIKSVLIAVCILFLGEHPIAQTSLMTALSLIMLILKIIVRPHKKIYFNIFLIGYEAMELIVLIALTILTMNQKGGFFVDIKSSMFEKLNLTFLIFWMLLRVWTALFGFYSLVEKAVQFFRKRSKTQEPKQVSAFSFRKSSKIVPVVSSPEGVDCMSSQRNEENKKLMITNNYDSNTGSTNTLQLGTQTPRLDSTLIGSTTSRTLIPDLKTDEGEAFVFSSAAARRRRIQKLKP